MSTCTDVAHTDVQSYIHTYREMDREMGRKMDRQTDRQMDGEMDRRMDGEMDRQLDRQKDGGRGRPPLSPLPSLGRFPHMPSQAWEPAEGYATQALAQDRGSVKALYRRALARGRLEGLAADARRDLERALELEPRGEFSGLVKAELARLAAGEAAGADSAPPADAAPADGHAFARERELRRELADEPIGWAEWGEARRRRKELEAQREGWRCMLRRLTSAAAGASTASAASADACSEARASLSASLRRLTEVEGEEPLPCLGGLSESHRAALADVGRPGPASSASSSAFVAQGPWLFDGSSSRDAPHDPRCNPAPSFSAEALVMWQGGIGHQSPLTSRDVEGQGAQRECRGYAFYVEPDDHWSFWLGAGEHWEKLRGPRAACDAWACLCGVVDAAAREARFYVDGELAASCTLERFEPNRRRPLRFGAGQSELEAARFFFRGCVAEVAVRDYALPPDGVPACGPGRRPAPEAPRGAESPRCLCEAACMLLARTARGAAGELPAATEAFHEETSRLLGLPDSDAVHCLFLRADLAAVSHDPVRCRLELDYGRPGVFRAAVLRCGHLYRLVYQVEAVCTAAAALRRQGLLREGTGGWLTARDVQVWLRAFEALCFGDDPEEVASSVNTVLLFAYWAETGLVSPDVRLVGFRPYALCQASL